MTDDLVKRPDDEQDDLTLVYMWAYKMAEKKYKSRIEELEAALRKIVAMTPDPEFGTLPIESAIKVARAALGEEKDAAT